MFGTIFKAWTQVGTAESVMKIGNKVTPYLLSERQIRLKKCIHQIWKLTNVDVHHCRCSSNVDIE